MVLRSNRMKVFNKSDYATLTWLTGQYFQNQVKHPWRGQEAGATALPVNDAAQSMHSRAQSSLHAPVYTLYKYTNEAMNNCYANYQLPCKIFRA